MIPVHATSYRLAPTSGLSNRSFFKVQDVIEQNCDLVLLFWGKFKGEEGSKCPSFKKVYNQGPLGYRKITRKNKGPALPPDVSRFATAIAGGPRGAISVKKVNSPTSRFFLARPKVLRQHIEGFQKFIGFTVLGV